MAVPLFLNPVLLGSFSKKLVRQACLARGWRFDDQAIVQR